MSLLLLEWEAFLPIEVVLMTTEVYVMLTRVLIVFSALLNFIPVLLIFAEPVFNVATFYVLFSLNSETQPSCFIDALQRPPCIDIWIHPPCVWFSLG